MFFGLPQSTVFWLSLMVVLLIIEGCTWNLTTIWFAAGALGAVLVSQWGGSPVMQAGCFVIVGLVSVVLTRPLVKKWKSTGRTPTNSDRNIGRVAQVLTEMGPTKAGRVRLDGVDWSAQVQGTASLQPGDFCQVADMHSTVLVVVPWQPK